MQRLKPKTLSLQCQLNKPNWYCSNCSKLEKKKKRKKEKKKGLNKPNVYCRDIRAFYIVNRYIYIYIYIGTRFWHPSPKCRGMSTQ